MSQPPACSHMPHNPLEWYGFTARIIAGCFLAGGIIDGHGVCPHTAEGRCETEKHD